MRNEPNTPFRTTGGRRRRTFAGAALALFVALAALAGCGSDNGVSAQEAYCEAGDALRSSVGSLASLDLIAEGTDGLESAVDQVEEDLGKLRDNAAEAAADEIDTLEASVNNLESALSDLGGEVSTDNVSALRSAIGDLGSAAEGVYNTLQDCP